jgi:3-phenylpropionate/trans-cinnamate dioxygenase ferredoxin subunit
MPAVAEWVPVAEERELPAVEESLRVVVDGHPLALFRLEDGLYALDDICSHEFSRLSEGEIWDDEVYCPKHGSRFDIRTGTVEGLPAIKPVGAYPVRVENGKVYVQWPAR